MGGSLAAPLQRAARSPPVGRPGAEATSGQRSESIRQLARAPIGRRRALVALLIIPPQKRPTFSLKQLTQTNATRGASRRESIERRQASARDSLSISRRPDEIRSGGRARAAGPQSWAIIDSSQLATRPMSKERLTNSWRPNMQQVAFVRQLAFHTEKVPAEWISGRFWRVCSR